jgi:hypothetical protein
MLRVYFHLADDMCFYLTAKEGEKQGKTEFLISPTLSALMTFHQ